MSTTKENEREQRLRDDDTSVRIQIGANEAFLGIILSFLDVITLTKK